MISVISLRKLKICYIVTLIMIPYLLNSIYSIDPDNFVSPDDPRITKLLASHYDCSKQYNLRQFSLFRVQECTQATSEKENARVFSSVYIKVKVKRIKAFRCVTDLQKIVVPYCAQGGQKNFRHDRMDWHANATTIPQELDPTECKNIIRFLNRTDSHDLHQFSQLMVLSTYFTNKPRNLQTEIERKQNTFTVSKLNTVYRGVLLINLIILNWIPEKDDNPYSRYSDLKLNNLS